ncbi:Alpha/Beta hydrolase protein [Chlamydoabsidia padenii]|nr:Alpha/Beta hydrolase protein [Chlamydoabsidia padenii]
MVSTGNLYTGVLGHIPKIVSTQHTNPYQMKSNDVGGSNKSSKLSTSFGTKELGNSTLRSDPKLGGINNNLIAFIRNRDIWLSDFDGNEIQLTFCSEQPNTCLRCGVAEYVMQEEFHRRTGYFWAPTPAPLSPNVNRILYLETNEEGVELVKFSNQTGNNYTNNYSTDSVAKYPRAGQPNVISQLRLLTFTNKTSPLELDTLNHKRLWDQDTIEYLYPWAEYIVRLGWLKDKESIWVQLLSRDQTRTTVIKIPCALFKTQEEHDLHQETNISSKIEELWSETQQTWINVSDAYIFLDGDNMATTTGSLSSSTSFIWSSELTGYRHLYYVTKNNNIDTLTTMQQLTSGDWCVIDKPLHVDEKRKLVYFMAKMDTPLEAHLYVTTFGDIGSVDQHRPIQRLTALGYSHSIEMNATLDVFIDQASCLHQPNGVIIQRLHHTDDNPLPTANDQYSPAHVIDINHSNKNNVAVLMSAMSYIDDINNCHNVIAKPSRKPSPKVPSHTNDNLLSEQHQCESTPNDMMKLDSDMDQCISAIPKGQFFDFMTSDGVKLYGCLYKPRQYRPGTSYPTILQIYGGPKTQMVTNEFKFPRLLRYLMAVYFGFAVVVIDGRGSSDRGLAFESYVKNSLGQVELQDQLQGLNYLATSLFGAEQQDDGTFVSVVDLDRVAITGWSYGGYLSLMGLARYNDAFKIAVAGAPVTKWELYDSAYTERYMGMPLDHAHTYDNSSILHWVDKLPNEENRLIIVHGLIDENVHFTNSELLVAQLVRLGKPYHLQVYPTEKHGLRHSSVNEHFDILMFHCLLNHL